MKVELQRQNQAFHYIAKTSDGIEVDVDANPAIGGEGKGARPMELMLIGIGGCASIDLGIILKKQRQHLEDYSVELIGVRNEDDTKAFNEVTLLFNLFGNLNSDKVQKALDLTIQKYCSAINSLKECIKINYKFQILNK